MSPTQPELFESELLSFQPSCIEVLDELQFFESETVKVSARMISSNLIFNCLLVRFI